MLSENGSVDESYTRDKKRFKASIVRVINTEWELVRSSLGKGLR